MSKNNNIPNIPAEKFKFVSGEDRLHDHKFETRQVSYLHDAFNRFCKNKGSVVAAIIILCLVIFSIIAPIFGSNTYTESINDTTYLSYVKLLPRNQWCVDLGLNFWDGAKDDTVSENIYNTFMAITQETGYDVVVEEYGTQVNETGKTEYNVRVDSYIRNDTGFKYMTLTTQQYQDIQKWQNETGIQVIYPAVDQKQLPNAKKTDASIWYETSKKGEPKLDKDGNFVDIYRVTGSDGEYNSLRIDSDPGKDNPEANDRYRYALITGTSDAPGYNCRIFLYSYFQYKYGFEPSFLFGTNDKGYDIMTRLAGGARFSFIFAICISLINLTIGAVYGAIEGYYGGWIDMFMERFSDILSRVPFIVVTTLFQLHLARKVGAIPSLLFAFVLTGWIGMASTVRMQFYRFKGQEYILAARSLGASDFRLMFRHIFPNSLGTIITSAVLVIPGVINSESSLTYLGIVNLDSATLTSVGTMLANGKDFMQNYPHILLFPALFLALLMISFNLFGNGLRDAFNPSLRGADE